MKITTQKKQYINIINDLLFIYSNPKYNVKKKLDLIKKILIKQKTLFIKIFHSMFKILNNSNYSENEILNYSYLIIINEVNY